MNTQFHTPSLGDEVFDLGDASTSTPASNFVPGNPVNNVYSNIYQQTPPSTKHMISLHNMSDEYHTANEESFNVTSNFSMNNSIIQHNTNTSNSNVPAGGQTGIATPITGLTTMAARKQMTPVDLNEPAKPLSAYALFFRDTVSAIKQQNPKCSFQELSKIVASMWDALDPVHKGVYNKKNELARTEYLKQIRIYQQQQQLKQDQLITNTNANETIQTETNVQQQTASVSHPETNMQPNSELLTNNNLATANTTISTTVSPNSGVPSEDPMRLLSEAGSVLKCTRENCNKRAIINPDWEDEYCSNECVVTHCRNVFNSWVQSNLEAKMQEQQQTTH